MKMEVNKTDTKGKITIRVLDFFFYYGRVVFFKVGLAVFRLAEERLLQETEACDAIELLKNGLHYDPQRLFDVSFNEFRDITTDLVDEMQFHQQCFTTKQLQDSIEKAKQAFALDFSRSPVPQRRSPLTGPSCSRSPSSPTFASHSSSPSPSPPSSSLSSSPISSSSSSLLSQRLKRHAKEEEEKEEAALPAISVSQQDPGEDPDDESDIAEDIIVAAPPTRRTRMWAFGSHQPFVSLPEEHFQLEDMRKKSKRSRKSSLLSAKKYRSSRKTPISFSRLFDVDKSIFFSTSSSSSSLSSSLANSE